MRSATAAMLLLAACGGGADPAPKSRHVALWDLAPAATLERLEEAPPAGAALEAAGVRVEGVEAGVAAVTVRLATRDAKDLPASPGRRLRFELPLPAVVALPNGLRAVPSLRGEGLPRELADDAEAPGYETSLSGSRLFVAFPEDAAFPDEVEVRYRVRAAHLFGAEPAGTTTADLVQGVEADRNAKAESLCVPAGARLTVQLPEVRAGTLRAVFRVPRGGSEVGVVARLGDEVLLERSLSERSPEAVVAATVPAAPAGAAFVVEVRGAAGGLVSVLAPHLSAGREPGDPPNLLVLLIDTLRADRLGALGGEGELTPALDRLAAESLVFTESWSTSSWTLPSVATVFTSTHAEQHRARAKKQHISTDVDTLASLLRDAGYRTAAVTDGGMVHHSFGLDRGFMSWDATGGPLPAILGRAREFLATAGAGPWFLFVHTYEVHSPYEPPDEARERVIARHGDVLDGHAAGPWDVMELLDETDGTWRVPDDLSAMMEALYDEEVRYADGLLGELLDELRAGGVLDSSVLVVTSDHGEEFGDHGLLGHSDTLYREQLHVPLLVRFPPGSPHARRNGERDGVPTSHLDLAPTLVDALGLGDLLVGTTFEGVSALAAERRSPIWATRFHPDVGLLTAVRDDDLVWIEGGYRARRFETGPELYDLSSDPAEHENLVREDPGEAARLSAVRRVLLERFGRPHGGDRPAELGAEHEARLEALGY